MPKRAPAKKKKSRTTGTSTSAGQLRKTLTRQKKATLVDLLLDIAQTDRKIMREVESRFSIRKSAAKLVADTRQAISDATRFDKKHMNYNFDYDSQAYTTIRNNLEQLVMLGRIKNAMDLCIELMRNGSQQVEMSDEGLMTPEIEECLEVVIQALWKSDMPPHRIIKWCNTLTKEDRVGFICDEDIFELRRSRKNAARVLEDE